MRPPGWLLIASLVHAFSPLEQYISSKGHLSNLRNRTEDLFFHGWNNYVEFGLPADEVRPRTCDKLGPDPDITHIQRNDVLGNFSVTLLDSVDMLAILDKQDLFEHYVDYIKHNVSFDVASVVQVFETTIRAIGGLLSAHLYASAPSLGHAIDGYDGHLLAQAYDLGLRLLPAFDSPSGIPYPRVHLQKGVVPIGDVNVTDTCSAGAGSLLLEFGMLSRLTGDTRFENLARKAFFEIWDRRSDINLVGMSIDAQTGKWLHSYTGNGASVDSIYEYALKYHVLFNDAEFLGIWNQMYDALEKHSSVNHWWYSVVDYKSGTQFALWIDALAAFWPGLQVLSGHLADAISNYVTYYKLWSTFGGIPERWQPTSKYEDSIHLEWYLLRPEFIESTYFLHQAAKDPLFLQVGEVALQDFETIYKAKCGFAGIQDVRTGELNNRMESFFLSETVKYLYLLFDPSHPLNNDPGNLVFTTEAHPFWYTPEIVGVAESKVFPRVQALVDGQGSKIKYEERGKNFLFDNPLEGSLSRRNLFRRAAKRDALSREKRRKPVTDPLLVGRSYCPRWIGDGSMSTVASWDMFYVLDEAFNYTRPAWLYRREDIEFVGDFYKNHIHDEAVCRA